jgi:rhodanese-related sulfurtransferase
VSAPTTRRILLAAAVVLGGLAPFARTPFPPSSGGPDVAALAAAVAAEQDHVDAIELAGWIRQRKPGLRVIDLRSSEEFEEYHIPRAEPMTIQALAAMPLRSSETVVLYSGGGAHAAQGWVFLRSRGFENVYFLRGGLAEWIDQVMNPTLPKNASPQDVARFARTAELSRYFGGLPRTGVDPAPSQSSAAVRRRGC